MLRKISMLFPATLAEIGASQFVAALSIPHKNVRSRAENQLAMRIEGTEKAFFVMPETRLHLFKGIDGDEERIFDRGVISPKAYRLSGSIIASTVVRKLEGHVGILNLAAGVSWTNCIGSSPADRRSDLSPGAGDPKPLTHVRQEPPPGPQIEKRHWNSGFPVRVTFRSREDISRPWCADFGGWAPLRPAITPIGYFPLLLSKIAQFADGVTHTLGEPRIAQTTEL